MFCEVVEVREWLSRGGLWEDGCLNCKVVLWGVVKMGLWKYEGRSYLVNDKGYTSCQWYEWMKWIRMNVVLLYGV